MTVPKHHEWWTKICFVNDGLPSEDDEDDELAANNADDWFSGVSKSHSTPNLGYGPVLNKYAPSSSSSDKNDSGFLERSLSSGGGSGDSEKSASDLRRDVLARQQLIESADSNLRKTRLELEAKTMLTKAKQAARMQMEIEKQSKLKRSKSAVEEIIGVTLGKRKLTRSQLSKMNITQLLIIINELHGRIQNFNEELVHLLIERDTLHMEQDSMLVDVQDLLQHQRKDDIKLPEFLVKLIDANNNNSTGTTSSSNSTNVQEQQQFGEQQQQNGLRKRFSFKMLKKVMPFSQNVNG